MYYVIRRLDGYPFRPDVGEVMTDEEYFAYALRGDNHTSVKIPRHAANNIGLCEEIHEAYYRPIRQEILKKILRREQ